METIRYHHHYDLSITSHGVRATLDLGDSLAADDIPVEGEIIRFLGRLYRVGVMDSADAPLLTICDRIPECGLWWDADNPAECESRNG